MDSRLFFHAFFCLLAAAISAALGKRLVIGALVGTSMFGIIGS